LTPASKAVHAPAGSLPNYADRLLFLDGLRALAALWVMFGHLYLFAVGWQQQTRWLAMPLNALMYLHLGVVVFLVLSGYCLALPAVRDGNRIGAGLPAFFTARALRILPPYFATLAAIVLVNYFVPLAAWGRNDLGLSSTISSQVWWTNLLLLQDVYGQYNNINGPFWSIACEWHLYFTFPALIWVLRRGGVVALLVLGGAVAWGLTSLSAMYPLLPVVGASVPQPPYFIALFVLGIAAAALSNGCGAAAAHIGRVAAWAGAALTVVVLYLLYRYRIVDVSSAVEFTRHHQLIDPLAGVVTATLLVVLSGLAPTHRLRRLFEQRRLVSLGGFSYSLYLIHIPILATVYTCLLHVPAIARLSYLQMFCVLALLGTPLCIGAAWIFARVFERRIRWRPASARRAAAPG
jgi:peptidoglycan/LPS O-acetylase OafA/YrhL